MSSPPTPPLRSTGSGTATVLRTMGAPLAWGTSYATITELLPDGRPLFVSLMRVAPAGVILVAIGWLRARWIPNRAEWARLAAMAMLNFGIFFPLLIVAAYRLPGGVAAAVGGVQPLLVGAITWAVTRQRLRRLDLVVGVVAAVGVTLVVVRPGAGIDALGVLAALGANIAFAGGVVATKRLPASPDRVSATGYQMLLSVVVIGPLMLAVEGPPPALTAVNVVGFAHLSLLATGVAFLVWLAGIPELPAQVPPVLGLAGPITGATLGWVLLGQELSRTQLIGFAITISAIAYAAMTGSRALNHHERVEPVPVELVGGRAATCA